MALLDRSEPPILVEFGRRRLVVADVRLRRDHVEIAAAIELAIECEPADADPAELGARLRGAMRDAGIATGPATIVLPREGVVAKRLELPGAREDELPEMVRFAMARELSIESGEAAIDFVPLAPAAGGSIVLAVAAPRRAVLAAAAILRAAECRPVRATLRSFGAIALADALRSDADRPIAIVDATGEGVELIVAGGGDIQFTLGTAAVAADDPEQRDRLLAADARSSEIRRAAFSFRLAHPELRPARVLVAGAGRDVEPARRALAGAFDSPVEPLAAPTLPAAAPAAAGLLAGVALAAQRGVPRLDLLHPRKAPDVAARRRQLAIAAVGLLVLALVGGFTLGRREAQRVERFRADLREKAQHFAPEGRRIRRDEDKLRHLQQWLVPSQDWIDDLLHLNALLPPPGDVVIDTIAATVESRGARWRNGEGWSSSSEVRIALDGEAKTRAIADALRTRLIEDRRFVVTTSGSDARGGNRLPYPFGYVLQRSRAAVEADAVPAAEALAATGRPSAGAAGGRAEAAAPQRRSEEAQRTEETSS
ncbi:MAG TPA: hypothetical protein PKC43_08245 [Phycisphaerales bacterium]|nr:hypothetical protein [Phycisphaerales bacterium]HMP37426.1 hypothetical protein [Phycisphaerales bacterium]